MAWRYRIVRPPVFGFASALYIIPSLALFAILGPITGYVASYPTAEIALVGYTLLILIWNTVAGLDAVPADAREAATAMGYSPRAALVRVDLPLALPYVFAGLRVAAATVIGLVTVTALIGLGGLGQQITYGFNIGFYTPIIVGLVLSVALAALCDLVLVGRATAGRPLVRGPRRAGAQARADMAIWDHFRHFVASVAGWFTTSANWSGPTGIPELFWRQAELSLAVVAGARRHRRRDRPRPRAQRAGRAGGGERRQRGAGRAQPGPADAVRHRAVDLAARGAGSWPPSSPWWSSPSRPSSPTPTWACARSTPRSGTRPRPWASPAAQVLRTVELPLAAPFLMAGIRTASIEVVATSTLAAYVSYADLGTPVISGLNTNDTVEAFAGALLVALLAALVAARPRPPAAPSSPPCPCASIAPGVGPGCGAASGSPWPDADGPVQKLD